MNRHSTCYSGSEGWALGNSYVRERHGWVGKHVVPNSLAFFGMGGHSCGGKGPSVSGIGGLINAAINVDEDGR